MSSSVAVAQSAPEGGSADDAVSIATPEEAARRAADDRNAMMAGAAERVEKARSGVLQAWMAYIPQGRARAFLAVTPAALGNPFAGFVDFDDLGPYVNFRLDAVLPLLASGQLFAARDLARANVALESARRDQKRAEQVRDAKMEWWAAWGAMTRMSVIDEAVAVVGAAFERLEELEDSFDAEYDPTDRARLRLLKADVDGHALQAERDLDVALARLARRVGKRSVSADSIPAEYLAGDRTLADAAGPSADRLGAEEARPERNQLRALRDLANANVFLESARFGPRLGIVARASIRWAPHVDDQRGSFNADPYNGLSGAAALGLDWELDLGKRIAGMLEALAQQKRAEAAQETARLQLDVELANATAEVEYWVDVLAHRVDAEAAAKSRLDLVLGAEAPPSVSSIRGALSSWLRTALALAEGRRKSAQAWVQLERAAGVELPQN